MDPSPRSARVTGGKKFPAKRTPVGYLLPPAAHRTWQTGHDWSNNTHQLSVIPLDGPSPRPPLPCLGSVSHRAYRPAPKRSSLSSDCTLSASTSSRCPLPSSLNPIGSPVVPGIPPRRAQRPVVWPRPPPMPRILSHDYLKRVVRIINAILGKFTILRMMLYRCVVGLRDGFTQVQSKSYTARRQLSGAPSTLPLLEDSASLRTADRR